MPGKMIESLMLPDQLPRAVRHMLVTEGAWRHGVKYGRARNTRDLENDP